jgi:monomeric isocitrate dehydrogenase
METIMASEQFKKDQKVVAVDGRYEARVLHCHRDGSITIRQVFLLRDGEAVPGTFMGDKHRINPALVQAIN